MSFGAILFLFFRTVMLGFIYVRSLGCLVSGFWSPEQCEVWVSSRGVSLKSNQVLNYYSHKICATIILSNLKGRTTMSSK